MEPPDHHTSEGNELSMEGSGPWCKPPSYSKAAWQWHLRVLALSQPEHLASVLSSPTPLPALSSPAVP